MQYFYKNSNIKFASVLLKTAKTRAKWWLYRGVREKKKSAENKPS